ncbi:(2Fe-2S)-binding protein [Adhaeribacter pallidiroseus]|uniref:Carbon-monoxide dehydrogenase (Acceptor) n=1 Tax=Adhaeribacter pallidiroseus TaxID=2072847 RepID=A0A369QC38_9BACT|nr:(2Fe-2S)-binding protein [Adhaeribacter pallidiroseus]RDC62463.1 Carbon-monoxide dehydrogenase (acceptor) [Adhaeribacter pallidiroseus]
MELQINGIKRITQAAPETRLLFVLRDELDLTGTKYGCGEGQCGACTVLVDGKATRSCQTPISSIAGQNITTIEGLEKNGRLHPVQEAYLKVDVFQCGYCASGMVLSTVALLKNNPQPSEEQIIDFMNGNVCRCGTYPRIIKAIQEAAAQA